MAALKKNPQSLCPTTRSMSSSYPSESGSTPGTPRSQIDDALYSPHDVAVIGMACRLPGDNNSPEELWQSMLAQKDASGEIPSMRWEPYLRRDPRNPKELQKITSRGYFLSHLEDFDAAFFGISPKEAEQMDPQQRLSLEVAWEALEDAGIAPSTLSGSDTAVFMGVNSDDYSKLLLEDIPNVDAWMGIGTAYCGVPNRISYHLNLMGPSTAVDAACASSLVAIHHGRQAIMAGESKIAIVGGVNALCGPGLTAVLDKAGATCPEGSCMSFDDNAHGYGRGEGAAIVILKRLSDAIEDNDNIHAVLKGSAVGQDGKTNGIMAPNAAAQEMVAREALLRARVPASTVQYVEAHATSTPLGDPTEVSALAGVYGKGRPKDYPVFVGSVKPNVGHLEAGAGAVGFIKAVLAMNRGEIPPQANLKTLNSKVDWESVGVKVAQQLTKWPATIDARRAGICSYGYGGTVSHAIIEQFQQPIPTMLNHLSERSGPQVYLLSAPREERLKTQVSALKSWISGFGKGHNASMISKTLTSRRDHQNFRFCAVAEDLDALEEILTNFSTGVPDKRVFNTRISTANRDGSTWVFSGHGAQWKAMGQELLTDAVFSTAVKRLEATVKAEMGYSLHEALTKGDFETSIEAQVLTYVMQIGLSAVLHSRGLTPTAVIGHSVGEIAASVEAGCLTDIEGALIVCRRARLYERVRGKGSMALVNIPFEEVKKSIGSREDLVAAIDTSPTSCVVSGTKEAVEEYLSLLRADGHKPFTVKTDIAFHSPMLNQLVEPLMESLNDKIHPQPASVRLYSTSNDDPRSIAARDVAYWTRNMVDPVNLTAAVRAAAEDGAKCFLEVSTHPIVSHSVTETLDDAGISEFAVDSTMLRDKPAKMAILGAIARLFCRGVPVDWSLGTGSDWDPDVPGTTWAHKPYWRPIQTGANGEQGTHDVDKHALLGPCVSVAGTDVTLYATKMDHETRPFPGNHPLHGTEIVPAAVLLNTFHHAANRQNLSNIVLRVPLAISAPRDVQVVLQKDSIKISSRLIQADAKNDPHSWLTHTTGSFDSETVVDETNSKVSDVAAVKARIGAKLADNFSIDYLDKVGVSAMGFPWAVTEHYGNLDEMIARVDVCPSIAQTEKLPWDASSWAPILDAATSVGSTLFFDDPKLRMPAQVAAVKWSTQDMPPKIGHLHVQRDQQTPYSVHVDVLGEDGQTLVAIRSMRFSEIEGTPGASGSVESLVHQLAWPPAAFSENPLAIDEMVFVGSSTQLCSSYSKKASRKCKNVSVVADAAALQEKIRTSSKKDGKSVVFYVPGEVENMQDIPESSERFIKELLDTVKLVAESSAGHKVFVLTQDVSEAATPTALAQGALQGLCRIIAAEHPDLWGGMIDNEDESFPLSTIRYVQNQDVVRIIDGLPRVARLRPLPKEKLHASSEAPALAPRPEGTYLITGGLGALGLEVARYLAEKGATRLVLLSRRALPTRSQWSTTEGGFADAIKVIQGLEKSGATVHVVSHDLGSDLEGAGLKQALETLSLPPVLGVVHAAGVLEDQLVMDTTTDSFARVLKPKISGALALHALFPPGTLDFFVLFSSCGQLFGFPGQSSYASGNAFLDSMATHRRALGDNAIAFQWTSWHGMGMAASTDFISAELESKGITDVSRDEAFRAWEHVAKYDIDHGVVLRALALEEGELLPVDILQDIAVRIPASGDNGGASGASAETRSSDAIPKSGPELHAYLETAIRECVAAVLMVGGIEDVDPREALSDLGVDSVMTVTLRRQLQSKLKVKIPPTLTWSHPTVSHLVPWFAEKLSA